MFRVHALTYGLGPHFRFRALQYMRSNATTLSINVQCSYAAYHTLGLGNKARPGTAVKSKRPSRADDSGGRAGNRRRATLEGGMFVPGDLSDLWMAVCASSPPPPPLPPSPSALFSSLTTYTVLAPASSARLSSIKCALVHVIAHEPALHSYIITA